MGLQPTETKNNLGPVANRSKSTVPTIVRSFFAHLSAAYNLAQSAPGILLLIKMSQIAEGIEQSCEK